MTNYEQVKVWRKQNKDKVAAQARRYRAKHPDKVKKVKDAYRMRHREEILPREAAQARARCRADPGGQRRRNLAYQERQRVIREQLAGRPRPQHCDICGEFQDGQRQRNIVWDHCHESGAFRGWICDRCNKTLGHVKDSADLLRKMAEYLEARDGGVDDSEKK